MLKENFLIRNAQPSEFEETGKLMVEAYSDLKGFPKQSDFPEYYDLLLHIGKLTEKPEVALLVALGPKKEVAGGVVYFGDMSQYGSKGIAPNELNAAGIRFLAVSNRARGQGIGKALTLACIQKAKESDLEQVILHTTHTMMTAWKMYEGMGFRRAEELDFFQGDLHVYGFRYFL